MKDSKFAKSKNFAPIDNQIPNKNSSAKPLNINKQPLLIHKKIIKEQDKDIRSSHVVAVQKSKNIKIDNKKIENKDLLNISLNKSPSNPLPLSLKNSQSDISPSLNLNMSFGKNGNNHLANNYLFRKDFNNLTKEYEILSNNYQILENHSNLNVEKLISLVNYRYNSNYYQIYQLAEEIKANIEVLNSHTSSIINESYKKSISELDLHEKTKEELQVKINKFTNHIKTGTYIITSL